MTDYGCPESVHLQNHPSASKCGHCDKPGCDFFKHWFDMTEEKATALIWVREPGDHAKPQYWHSYPSFPRALISAEGASLSYETNREVFTIDAELKEVILAKVEFVRATTRTVIQDVS